MNRDVFESLDTTGISRRLAQIGDREGDVTDAYFEGLELFELPADEGAPGVRVRRERGFAVRLLRGGRTWLASRDGLDPAAFHDALRQVARALPAAGYPELDLTAGERGAAAAAPEVLEFPDRLERALRRRHLAAPLALTVRRHRRWSRVVGARLAAEEQRESFYSCVAELPWVRHGAVSIELDDGAADRLAEELAGHVAARRAAPPGPGRHTVVLGAAATAVLLHEAVAHALETDTLALAGRPEAAVGVRVGSAGLGVLDDPSSLPAPLRRTADDEGVPVMRRWLVRDGAVEQPLADLFAAARSSVLAPGAARRGSRHRAPAPRSTHLELVPGEAGDDELAAGARLWAPQASRGRLDPLRGDFVLELPWVRRLRDGEMGETLGPCRLRGRVAELLGGVSAVGRSARLAGAGWCAKDGLRVPVWATVPAVRVEGAQIE